MNAVIGLAKHWIFDNVTLIRKRYVDADFRLRIFAHDTNASRLLWSRTLTEFTLVCLTYSCQRIPGADPGLRREARKFLGYFVWKITILRQKIIFFPILGGASPLNPTLNTESVFNYKNWQFHMNTCDLIDNL
jgi:hypothetical protein